MEIDAIKKELEEKEAMAAELRALLADEDARWSLIRKELRAAKKQFADERRSTVAGPDAALDYDAEDYIIAEDVVVIVTRDGWVKRQRSYTTLDAIRVREGDEVAYALGGSPRASLVFFTPAGRAYTLRVDDLPQTSGYGDPIQKYFDFSDGERLAGARDGVQHRRARVARRVVGASRFSRPSVTCGVFAALRGCDAAAQSTALVLRRGRTGVQPSWKPGSSRHAPLSQRSTLSRAGALRTLT